MEFLLWFSFSVPRIFPPAAASIDIHTGVEQAACFFFFFFFSSSSISGRTRSPSNFRVFLLLLYQFVVFHHPSPSPCRSTNLPPLRLLAPLFPNFISTCKTFISLHPLPPHTHFPFSSQLTSSFRFKISHFPCSTSSYFLCSSPSPSSSSYFLCSSPSPSPRPT